MCFDDERTIKEMNYVNLRGGWLGLCFGGREDINRVYMVMVHSI